ncbi:MAG TPA: YraN family protein [Gemmatimonadales bacterium]|nr:YraN family protein [Gemmatimonadales bacterium]
MLKSDPSTWTDERHRRGVEAEWLAAGVLAAAGFEIIEQRFRFGRHDVDLVARRGSTVVFAEVKSRQGRQFGAAAEAVTARKQALLTRTASVWLQRYGRPGDVARFDVITVEGEAVDWVQDAYRPLWR